MRIKRKTIGNGHFVCWYQVIKLPQKLLVVFYSQVWGLLGKLIHGSLGKLNCCIVVPAGSTRRRRRTTRWRRWTAWSPLGARSPWWWRWRRSTARWRPPTTRASTRACRPTEPAEVRPQVWQRGVHTVAHEAILPPLCVCEAEKVLHVQKYEGKWPRVRPCGRPLKFQGWQFETKSLLNFCYLIRLLSLWEKYFL